MTNTKKFKTWYSESIPSELFLKVFDDFNILETKNFESWDLFLYSKNLKPYDKNYLPELNKNATISFLENTNYFSNKGLLYSSLFLTYGIDITESIMPPTYLVGYKLNMDLLRERHQLGMTYILKNPKIQRREGIFIIQDLSEIEELSLNIEGAIIQPFIESMEVSGGHRVTLRLYALVMSEQGKLDVWLHKQGRFNYSILPQKNEQINRDSMITACSSKCLPPNGSPIKLEDLEQDLKKLGTSYKELEYKIVKLFTSVCDSNCKNMRVPSFMRQAKTFKFFGLDFILKPDGNPCLLEINLGPDLKPAFEYDREMKTNVITDFFRIIGVIEDENSVDVHHIGTYNSKFE